MVFMLFNQKNTNWNCKNHLFYNKKLIWEGKNIEKFCIRYWKPAQTRSREAAESFNRMFDTWFPVLRHKFQRVPRAFCPRLFFQTKTMVALLARSASTMTTTKMISKRISNSRSVVLWQDKTKRTSNIELLLLPFAGFP